VAPHRTFPLIRPGGFGYHFDMESTGSPPHSHRTGPARRVVVAGGGLAGCAAAFSLARALGPGTVTLLEARTVTGGRARSFTDPTSGEILDNCQHLMMGCCVNLRQFTDALGSANALGLANAWTRQPYLTFATPDGARSRFYAANLPSPLHLAAGFARLHTLSMGGKISVARAILALVSRGADLPDEPLPAWLARHSQGERECRAFWEPVLVSALNDRMDRLGISAARQVFVEAFLGGKSAFDVWLPSRPLWLIFGAEMRRALEQAGVIVRTDCAVRKIEDLGNGNWSVVTRNGDRLESDHLVLATPHKISWELLHHAGIRTEEGPSGQGNGGWSEKLGLSSITTIHLWFNRRFLPLEHAALVGGLGHWVFRKTWAGPEDPYCQVLISASDHLLMESADSLIQQAASELFRFFPESKPNTPRAQLIRGRVVREKNATFRQTPGMDLWRPGNRLPRKNITLAGDYTRTGWPATMEGAVRSGLLASHDCLESMGLPPSMGMPVWEPKHNWFQRLLTGR